jgi:DNA topoisomerase I
VKTMEEKGIGRPSTYAPTIETIRQRGYVYLEEKRFYVSDLGRIVNDLLVSHFGDIMNVEFTAAMENDLDQVEEGQLAWQQVVRDFYVDFAKDLAEAEKNIAEIEIEDEVSDEVCELCGRQMVIKWGRFGKFLACPGFPDCRNTKSFLKETGTPCPLCSGAVVERISKKGKRFFGCENYPECEFISWDKPMDKACPQCGAYLVEKTTKKRGTFYRCSNQECNYEEVSEDEPDLENEVK